MVVPFIVIGVFYVALFATLIVFSVGRQKRLEREAHYTFEIERELIAKGEKAAENIHLLRKAAEYAHWHRRREGLKLGGLITTALGGSILIAFNFFNTVNALSKSIGLIPFVIGIVVLFYAYVLYPKPDVQQSEKDSIKPKL